MGKAIQLASALSDVFSPNNLYNPKSLISLYHILKNYEVKYLEVINAFYDSKLSRHPEWIQMYTPFKVEAHEKLRRSWRKMISPVELKPELDIVLSVLSNFIEQCTRCCPYVEYSWSPTMERWQELKKRGD